jgi:hypothetical protein
MTMQISGAAMLAHPAVQSALSSVMQTPQFAQLVAQHAAAQGMQPPITSVGGPGAAYGGQPQVQDRPLQDIRALSLGFKQTNIGVGTNFNVTNRPQVLFRSERLVIPDSPAYPNQSGATQADSFDVLDIKVGNRSQLVSGEAALPGRAFAENAVGVRLAMDTASIAQDIIVAVLNTDVASATFRAIIFGTSAF